jgi:hypothetical protein
MVYSPTNNVLASLASSDAEALRPHMKSIDLRQGAVVGEPGKTIDRVIFRTQASSPWWSP